jgi:hypothetical protein
MCRACDGTGWVQAWELVTYRRSPGGGTYKAVDIIRDPEATAQLAGQVDGSTQAVYPGVLRCRECSGAARGSEAA